MQLGLEPDDWVGKPIIAVLNTWSDINPCHGHLRDRVEDVKRGVYQVGGLPLELTSVSLFENLLKPSALLFRNLLAMEVEEQLRAYPIDGVVLMGGCDKSTPGLLLGAISAGFPATFVPAGPMLRGNSKGRTLGSGSDAFKYWDEYRAGNIGEQEIVDISAGIARSYHGDRFHHDGDGEALGMALPGASSIPAVDSNHQRMCARSGRQIVRMVWDDQKPAEVMSRESFQNAIAVAMAMGCSTNAIIHLIALARRVGHDIGLDEFEKASRQVPVIANIRPNGDKFLMEDFHYAGGLPGLMSRIRPHLHLSAKTVSGRSLGENIAAAEVYDDDVIRPLENPVYAEGALAVLKGNLAPDGCVIKPSACSPKFLKHTGPALVYDNYPALKADIERLDMDVTENHVLILRNAGPQGGPGMPEWGMLPIPTKLVKAGVRDMLRISDARMSGTSYGACVLHVAPEAFIGGPLALVRSGDLISVDVPARSITLEVTHSELERRRVAWTPPPPRYERGYGWMFCQHTGQADIGCDFDFLRADFGRPVSEPIFFES
jgi:dihydroxy-acid dehydratase